MSKRQIQTFQEFYQTFIEYRDSLFDKLRPLGLEKQKDENNPMFCLRVAQYYELHFKTDETVHDYKTCNECMSMNYYELSKLFLDTLTSGRKFIFRYHDQSFLKTCEEYLVERGYNELFNAYMFCAPIDAVNYKHKRLYLMKDDVKIDNWHTVMWFNNESKCSVYHQFLTQYKKVYQQFKSGLLDDDPYPSKDMKFILSTSLY